MINDPSITACFTGHRPAALFKVYTATNMKQKLSEIITGIIRKCISLNITQFISGGALGVDQIAAKCVLELKKEYPFLKLIIAKPFPGQCLKWHPDQQVAYLDICNKADEVIEVSDGDYQIWKMHARNKWMVDHSSILIAIKMCDVNTGGTFACYSYAQRVKKLILQYCPLTDDHITLNQDSFVPTIKEN